MFIVSMYPPWDWQLLCPSLKNFLFKWRGNEYQQAVNLGYAISDSDKLAADNLMAAAESEEFLFDTTVPGTASTKGGIHPIIQTMYELNDAFHSIGFRCPNLGISG